MTPRGRRPCVPVHGPEVDSGEETGAGKPAEREGGGMAAEATPTASWARAEAKASGVAVVAVTVMIRLPSSGWAMMLKTSHC